MSVALPEGDSATIVYTDVWVRPGADDLSGKGFAEAQGAYTGFFRVAAGGELYVFNGDGQGGGQWLPTQVQLPVEDSGQARDWIRLSMRQDYRAKVWDLYINGTIFRANMGFWKDAAESQTNARFVFTGTTAHSLLLDDFSVSTDSLLFADADHDGLPDEWEKTQGLDAAASGRDDDPDGDGLTNVEELVIGTQPLVADSDGDGASDGAEVLAGRNPALKERHWKNLNFFAPEMPDAEFIRHRVVLAVPFLLTGKAEPVECNALLSVLDAYVGLGQPDKVEGFEAYLKENPKSPFASWIRAHAAITAFERSRYSKALPMLEDLWKTLPESDPLQPAGVVRSIVGTNLAAAYHLYGRTDEMGTVLETLDRAGLPGGVAERAHQLKSDQWAQKYHPEQNNRCGYSSLTALAQQLDPAIGARLLSQQVADDSPGKSARTLAQLADLAVAAKLPVRLAHRSAKAAWVYPSLIHWKPGHFSVLLGREADGRYLINDPGANTRRLVSAETLGEETSGACLVATSDLPAGWGALGRAAAEAAVGRSGVTQSSDDKCNKGSSCTSCQGVAEADFNSFRASLVVSDTPLVDSAPRGPGNSVHATWGQHSSSLLCYLSYAGLGSGTNWTLGYSGYVDTGSGSRAVFDGAGNRTTHNWNGTTFDR